MLSLFGDTLNSFISIPIRINQMRALVEGALAVVSGLLFLVVVVVLGIVAVDDAVAVFFLLLLLMTLLLSASLVL